MNRLLKSRVNESNPICINNRARFSEHGETTENHFDSITLTLGKIVKQMNSADDVARIIKVKLNIEVQAISHQPPNSTVTLIPHPRY